jgi:hypothetical protein
VPLLGDLACLRHRKTPFRRRLVGYSVTLVYIKTTADYFVKYLQLAYMSFTVKAV